MEIGKKTIILIILGVSLYLYLTDIFSKPNFQTSIREMMHKAMGNNTNHTLLDLIEKKTNTVAGVISASSITILNWLPVSLLTKFFL